MLFRSGLPLGLVLLALAACSGGGGGSEADGQPATGNGTLKLSITDAPVDEARSVVVQFNAVAFKREGSEPETIQTLSPSPRQIDLLQYQGGRAALLLDDVTLPAGRYEWVRLMVDNEPNVRDSYLVRTTGEECELRIPSGAETGLKLNRGFDLPADGSLALTIDFDLRKSVRAPPGQRGSTASCTQGYLMRPTLRIVEDANAGAIAGVVDASLVTAECLPNVYVFTGSDVVPDDMEETNASGDVDPLVVVPVVVENGSTDYGYRAAFLPAGPYTVAFSCGDDDPEVDDVLEFSPTQNAAVQSNLITTIDFDPPPAP